MDAYNKIINDTTLYPTEIVEKFAKRHHRWHIMSPREKELLLLHIMICVYLCNKEIEPAPKKGVRKHTHKGPHTAKKQRLDLPFEPLPSTSKQQHADTSSSGSCRTKSSSATTASNDDDILLEIEEIPDLRFRYQLLNYMPLKENTLIELCTEWGLNNVTHQWDIVDIYRQTLVMVRYTSNEKRSMANYFRAKAENPANSEIYIILWGETVGRWVEREDTNDIAQGETKVTRFLLDRSLAMATLNIPIEFFKVDSSEIGNVFNGKWIKDCLAIWKTDLLMDENRKLGDNELFPMEKPPADVTPDTLLEKLDTVSVSEERTKPTMYKGRLYPEHLVVNVPITASEDSSSVDAVALAINDVLENLTEIHKVNLKEESTLYPELLREIMEAWEHSNKSTFNFVNRTNMPSIEKLEAALGVKMKGRTFSGLQEDMKQPEPNPFEKRYYAEWYEEVITGLEEKHDYSLGHSTYGEILTIPPQDGHPVATFVEPLVTEAMKPMLKTKASVLSSKLTNLYSRLGGAYQQGTVETNKERKNIAIFPIIAQLTEDDNIRHENLHRLRLCSGIVIRAPSHARRGTDRIRILTIELLKPLPINFAMVKYINGCILYESPYSLVLLRQNSVMKEDSTYNTFTMNALFTPINMLGCMTLENPAVPVNQDMPSLIQELLESGESWFIDRYVEGLMFALIGNSRDEGYFAALRKIFLVLYTWRKRNMCANFDVASFCTKVNECLIDNPISMHFHETLLDILRTYSSCPRRSY